MYAYFLPLCLINSNILLLFCVLRTTFPHFLVRRQWPNLVSWQNHCKWLDVEIVRLRKIGDVVSPWLLDWLVDSVRQSTLLKRPILFATEQYRIDAKRSPTTHRFKTLSLLVTYPHFWWAKERRFCLAFGEWHFTNDPLPQCCDFSNINQSPVQKLVSWRSSALFLLPSFRFRHVYLLSWQEEVSTALPSSARALVWLGSH